MGTKKVKFISSPLGRFGLSYFVGDVVTLGEALCDELIESKCAVEVKEEPKASPPKKIPAQSPTKKKPAGSKK